ASEYERARTNIITQYESYFNERSKTRSINYAEEYINHFTEGGYIPGIEMEYNLINMLAPNIPVELVNQYAMELVGDENIFITYEGPEKEGVNIPTREQLLTWLEEVRKEEIEPIAETLSNEPLLSEMPKGGTIVKEEHDKTYDATIYTLSNGVRVIIKSTNLKDDEILMTATSPGGSSLFPESDPINIQVYGDLCNIGGLGNFSASDLNKILAGKKASLSPSISILDEGFNGSSNVRDFETLLQLVYLNFTAPRMDQDAFESLIGRTRSQLEAMDAMPEMKFYKKAPEILYENPARFRQIEAADLDKVNYETIMNWRKERYADASDFTFIFVGNIDAKEHKDLLALYLGSLPSIDRKESFKPINVNYKSGMQAETIHQTMDNPKAIVMDLYWGNMEFNYKNVMIKDMLKQILTIVYQEKIREDEGGTYGVGVSSNLEYYPAGRAAIQVSFETENGKETYLNEIVKREFEAIAKNGPRAEDFAKVKEYVLKQRADGLQHNSYWRNSISQYYRLGLDNYSDFENIINSITPADIQKAAKTIIGAGNLTELYFVGDKK
ncbi:insulinase family protein, partial [Bacteroidales bacterium OttesenSCG-928-I14]|nr:insulinase family protein [Bacteroidales bacterium OttesenSCG-928-I14]